MRRFEVSNRVNLVKNDDPEVERANALKEAAILTLTLNAE